jgi:hypothetical protein
LTRRARGIRLTGLQSILICVYGLSVIADLADRGAHPLASRIQTTNLLALPWHQFDVGSDRTQ